MADPYSVLPFDDKWSLVDAGHDFVVSWVTTTSLESPRQQHGGLPLVVQQTDTLHFLSFISQVRIVVNATKRTFLNISTDVTNISVILN